MLSVVRIDLGAVVLPSYKCSVVVVALILDQGKYIEFTTTHFIVVEKCIPEIKEKELKTTLKIVKHRYERIL